MKKIEGSSLAVWLTQEPGVTGSSPAVVVIFGAHISSDPNYTRLAPHKKSIQNKKIKGHAQAKIIKKSVILF